MTYATGATYTHYNINVTMNIATYVTICEAQLLNSYFVYIASVPARSDGSGHAKPIKM